MTESSPARPAAVKSAARAVNLLEVLAAREGVPARLPDIAAALDAPRSSTHALLQTLVEAGWVRTDASATAYVLGIRALLVGTSFLEADPYVRLVRPILADLRDELHETVHMARADQNRVVYLVTQESGQEARRVWRIGRWLPAHATSLGKAIFAERDELPAGPLEALTPQTLTDVKALAKDLAVTRGRGYAMDIEEGTAGVRCIGVALRYTNPVTDAISCTMPLARWTQKKGDQVIEAMLRTRALIEESAPLQGTF